MPPLNARCPSSSVRKVFFFCVSKRTFSPSRNCLSPSTCELRSFWPKWCCQCADINEAGRLQAVISKIAQQTCWADTRSKSCLSCPDFICTVCLGPDSPRAATWPCPRIWRPDMACPCDQRTTLSPPVPLPRKRAGRTLGARTPSSAGPPRPNATMWAPMLPHTRQRLCRIMVARCCHSRAQISHHVSNAVPWWHGI